jgi:hypothetical protein
MYNAMIIENIWDNRILWKLKLHKNLFVVFKGSDTHKGYPCSTKLDGEYKMCILWKKLFNIYFLIAIMLNSYEEQCRLFSTYRSDEYQ